MAWFRCKFRKKDEGLLPYRQANIAEDNPKVWSYINSIKSYFNWNTPKISVLSSVSILSATAINFTVITIPNSGTLTAKHSDGTVFTDLTTFDPSTDYFYFSGSAEKDDFQIRNGSISRSGGNEGNTQTVTILGNHQTDSNGFRLYYPIYIERDITINDVLCFSTT